MSQSSPLKAPRSATAGVMRSRVESRSLPALLLISCGPVPRHGSGLTTFFLFREGNRGKTSRFSGVFPGGQKNTACSSNVADNEQARTNTPYWGITFQTVRRPPLRHDKHTTKFPEYSHPENYPTAICALLFAPFPLVKSSNPIRYKEITDQ